VVPTPSAGVAGFAAEGAVCLTALCGHPTHRELPDHPIGDAPPGEAVARPDPHRAVCVHRGLWTSGLTASPTTGGGAAGDHP